MRALTPAQTRFVEAVRTLTAKLGYPPTHHELRKELGFASVHAVACHVTALERKRVVSATKGERRSIRIIGDAPPEPARPTWRLMTPARCLACDTVFFGGRHECRRVA